MVNGLNDGLKLELLLPPPNTYVLDEDYGIRVFIGDESIESARYEEFYVAPGTRAVIGIKKVLSKALPYPYSDCNTDLHYRRRKCLYLCYETIVKDMCGCGHFSQPLCTTFNETMCDVKCNSLFVKGGFLADECSMKCTSKCEQTSYDLSTSYIEYPSDNYAKIVFDNKDYMFKNFDYSLDVAYLKKNMIAINVFWKNLEYTLIEESPTTSELELISNVGGLLGENFIYTIFILQKKINGLYLYCSNLKRFMPR
jgi:hypothetical protein